MKNFLIYTLATICGIIISSFLFFIIMIAGLSAVVASGDKPASLSDNSVLVLKAGVPIPDRGNPNPWASFDFINMTVSPAPGLNDILNNIRKAEKDNKIKGILIENGALPSGWATASEIRKALISFRESGKFVVAWADYLLTQEGYYLSTAADRIFVNPGVMMEFKGLSGDVMFYKKALDKLGIDVQVIRHGKFKGAVEPFMLNELSRENREQIEDYVGSIWDDVLTEIADARKSEKNTLNKIADQLTVTSIDQALKNSLVDGIMYRNELIDTLKVLSGLKSEDKLRMVPMYKYTKIPESNRMYSSENRIAVIYAEGTIVTGKGNETNIGGNNYADIIRAQRKDTSIKAIVLRVNSPGGNAIASDIIWHEVELAASVKPVVVSMGNYAASGGYYISAAATKILASPQTISGSIGVFGMIPDASSLLKDKLGISTESVTTNTYSDFPSIYRPMDSWERKVMQNSIEKIYSDFIGKVSSGRNMPLEKVDSIGQGRIWSGTKARKLGLIDEFGGLDMAIKKAAELAGTERYSIREYPVLEDPYTKFLYSLSGEIGMKIIQRELGENLKYYRQIKELGILSGIQARMPYFIEIR